MFLPRQVGCYCGYDGVVVSFGVFFHLTLNCPSSSTMVVIGFAMPPDMVV